MGIPYCPSRAFIVPQSATYLHQYHMPRLMLKYFLLGGSGHHLNHKARNIFGGNSLLDAYCAILACNQLWERFPDDNHAPGLTDATFVLSTEDLELIEYEYLTEHQRAYVRNLVHSPMGRRFFNTLEEYIGLAPATPDPVILFVFS
jgi:hypothetical protein